MPVMRQVVPDEAAAVSGGIPAPVLGTANAAGDDVTFLRTDDQIAVFDATVPVTQASADAAAVGSAAVAARRDHRHGMPNLRSYVTNGSRTAAAGSGTQSVTGVPFVPRAAIVFAAINGAPANMSVGALDNNTGAEIYLTQDFLLNWATTAGTLISMSIAVADAMTAVGTLTADGVDLVWTRSGAGGDTNWSILFLG